MRHLISTIQWQLYLFKRSLKASVSDAKRSQSFQASKDQNHFCRAIIRHKWWTSHLLHQSPLVSKFQQTPTKATKHHLKSVNARKTLVMAKSNRNKWTHTRLRPRLWSAPIKQCRWWKITQKTRPRYFWNKPVRLGVGRNLYLGHRLEI